MFGLGYDKSLSIILNNDNKKRKIIVDFLDSVPRKLYVYLLNQIDNLNNEEKNTYYREISFRGVIYFYLIDNKDRSMTIGSCMKKNSYDNSIFLLKLYPYNDVDEIDECLPLGNVIYQYKDLYKDYIYDCDKVEYSLIKDSFGINFMKTYGYKILFNKIVRRVVDHCLSVDEILSFEKKKGRLKKKVI